MNQHPRSLCFNFLLTVMLAIAFILPAQSQDLQPYRMRDKEVEQILRNLERQADTFRQSLRAALNKSHFNGTNREGDVNAFVKDFDRETKRLHDHFNEHKSTGADVKSVLDRAADIDRFMSRNRLTPIVHNDWNVLRSNLEQLAETYNVTWRWDLPSALGTPVVGAPFRLNDKDVERILRNLERQSDKFRASLDSALDRNRLDGTRREDDINAFVKDFNVEVKRLRNRFDDHKATSAEVQSVLDRAVRIDQFTQRHPLSTNAQSDWAALRANLDELARAFNMNWNWSGIVSPGSIADLPVVATITSSGSTNTPGWRISLTRGGRAEVAFRNSLATKEVPAALTERFFADLTAAMPLAQLPSAQPCFKSSSFGGSIYVTFGNQRSPDLSCASGPRAQVLEDDIAGIKRALNVR